VYPYTFVPMLIKVINRDEHKPSRVKIRSTGFLHLQVLNKLANNLLLADLVTVINTLDLVSGEIDW